MPQRYRIKKKDDVYKLLKKKRNFEFMNELLLQQLVDNMSVFRFKKGETVLTQGKRTKSFFILITGKVSVFVDKKYLYALNRTGDVVGELSFITQNPCSATVKASDDVGLVAIDRELLKKVNKVEFFLWLCRILGDKLVRTSKIKTGTLDKNIESSEQSGPSDPEGPQEDDLDMVDEIARISPEEIEITDETKPSGVQQLSDIKNDEEEESSSIEPDENAESPS